MNEDVINRKKFPTKEELEEIVVVDTGSLGDIADLW